jgi:hypothetical protein
MSRTSGIIAAGMAGMANQVVDIAKGGIEMDRRAQLMELSKAADLEKAHAIEDMKREFSRRDRTEMADDINRRTEGIIANQQADRLNNFYSKDGSTSNLKPEDLSDEEKFMVQPTDADKSAARRRAAAEGGWLSPKDEGMLDARDAALEGQNQRLSNRLDSNERMTRERLESQERIAEERLRAVMEKLEKQGQKGSAADRLTTIVNSMNATIKNLTESDRPKTPEGKQAWQKQMDDAIALRDLATRKLKGRMDSDDPGSGYPDSSPAPAKPGGTPKAGSGNGRKDVQDALKLWNNGQ